MKRRVLTVDYLFVLLKSWQPKYLTRMTPPHGLGMMENHKRIVCRYVLYPDSTDYVSFHYFREPGKQLSNHLEDIQLLIEFESDFKFKNKLV